MYVTDMDFRCEYSLCYKPPISILRGIEVSMSRAISFLLLVAGIAFSGTVCLGQPTVWQSPTPSSTEAAKVLQAVCPYNAQSTGGGALKSLPGCKPCPVFTTDAGMANGEMFDLESVIYGSFTAPGIEEAVASFNGCEPHTSLFGGSILLRKIGNSWSMMRFLRALITKACRTYRLQSGRALLVCEQEDGHAEESEQWISVVDLSKEEPRLSVTVFSVLSTAMACGPTAVGGTIESATLTDLNGDGMPDLRLGVSVGQGTFPQDGGSCFAEGSEWRVQKYKLDFLFQPDTLSFLPAPSSRATLDKLNALFKNAEQKATEITIRRLHH